MQGANVYLTIDARIQAIARKRFARSRVVRQWWSIPITATVLAMVSVPSFDPNTFIPSIKAKDWAALQKDEARPLVNRALSTFPPGSTFKIVTSLAGLRRNLSTARFNC
jgi:penicillin-binding protein 2